MTRAPTSRVETPQEVVQAKTSCPFWSWNLISWAREKFCPRKCDVPACRALRSCIMASMLNVDTAPGNRSPAVFSPLITGIAIQFSAKSA